MVTYLIFAIPSFLVVALGSLLYQEVFRAVRLQETELALARLAWEVRHQANLQKISPEDPDLQNVLMAVAISTVLVGTFTIWMVLAFRFLYRRKPGEPVPSLLSERAPCFLVGYCDSAAELLAGGTRINSPLAAIAYFTVRKLHLKANWLRGLLFNTGKQSAEICIRRQSQTDAHGQSPNSLRDLCFPK